ncbi:MAG: thiamine pyrophosphate-binding protein [Alphaproteobacteria bacterium]|nr:thiamine pyrophosphate-binding protein [Alphaproteobacteria bacterium]
MPCPSAPWPRSRVCSRSPSAERRPRHILGGSMNGGDALVATLVAHDIRMAFCVPGESYLAVLEALRTRGNSIRLITNRHESGATFAAEAYAKATRTTGIAFVSRGPGATNGAIGVHVASQDSTPLVLFVGHIPQAEEGLESFQEIDYHQMYGSIAKAVIEPVRPDQVAAATARALHLAATGRPGPVVVVLPEDITEADAGEVAIPVPARTAPVPPAPEAIAAAAAMIGKARHPVVIAGEMVVWEGASAPLLAFARKTGAGIFAAWRRQDVVPNNDPAYIGHLGLGPRPAQAAGWDDVDLILAMGARLDFITIDDSKLIRPEQKLIHVYPDGSVMGRHRIPDVAITASIVPTLKALTATVTGRPGADRLAWRKRMRAAHLDYAAVKRKAVGAVDLARIVGEVDRRLGRTGIITTDAGNFATWIQRHYSFPRPGCQIAPIAGAMGYGVPAGLAAKLAHPDATVVTFVGDGGFLMTGQEVATAVHEGVAVKVIVCDNCAYGTILMHQHRRIGKDRYHGSRLTSPDFAQLAKGYGLAGFTVRRTEEFAPAFERALAHPGPALIHVVTDLRDISAHATLE